MANNDNSVQNFDPNNSSDLPGLAKAYHAEVARLLLKMANGHQDVNAVVDKVMHRTLALRRQLRVTDTVINPQERVQQVSEAFEKLCQGRDLSRIPTGLPCLDNVLLGGLEPGTITLVAGATASGKSVWLQQAAEHAGLSGANVLFIAVEMGLTQLSYRSLARFTGIEASRIRRGWMLSPEEQDRVREAIAKLSQIKVHYKDQGDMSTAGVYEAVLKVQEKFGKVDLVVIDYIQILQDEQGGGNENLRLTNISRNLAGISREFNVPLLVGSQLSRDCVKRGRKPMPQDLRDCGSIENDATTVILLYPFNDPDAEVRESIERVDLVVGKNRNGIQDIDIKTNFHKPLQKFVEFPPDQQGIAGEGLTEQEVSESFKIEKAYSDPEYLNNLPF